MSIAKPLWRWANTRAHLEEILELATSEGAVAVDTEFRRRDTFYPQVALVQLAVCEHCWLIDPLTLDDTAVLSDLMVNPEIIKVLHSASEDLEVFEHWLGLLPSPMVDTQRAAALLGDGFGLSYRALVAQRLGVELAKEETQSDWLQRPLSSAQCEYAAQDVTYLIRCWREMASELALHGRLPWALEDGATMATGGKGPLAKFKSAWKLKPGQLGALLALIAWREDEAMRRDKPRNWIVHDKVINALAHSLPDAMPQLSTIEGLPASVIRRDGKQILAAVKAGSKAGEAGEVPSLSGPVSSSVKKLAKQLGVHMQHVAAQMGVNPEILLPGRDLELLAREALGETVDQPASWRGWRADAIVSPLRHIAAKEAV